MVQRHERGVYIPEAVRAEVREEVGEGCMRGGEVGAEDRYLCL